MKKAGLSILLLFLLASVNAAPGNSAAYGQNQQRINPSADNADLSLNQDPDTTVTYQTFYDELSPYGKWIDYPGYGYVWSPAEPDFRPYYTNGEHR
jgi:hypothetical protein